MDTLYLSPPSMYHSAQSYAEPPAFPSSKLWRGDVGIALYAAKGAMVEKILRFAQNDRKYAKFPQAFPLEVIPPRAGGG